VRGKAKNKRADTGENKGLTIKRDEGHITASIVPGKRLYLTADGSTLVPTGHKDARTLYCTELKSVPRKEFESLKKA